MLTVVVAAVGLAVVGLAACQQSAGPQDPAADPSTGATAADQRYPDVLDAVVTCEGETCDVEVTISSPYDTAQRYADGWRVSTPDGEVLGEHTLTHDHASEQPFTRTQRGLEIPDDVGSIVVQGRDQEFGFGGRTVTVPVPDR
ncbi:hypothetical protein ACNHYB_02770 [Isoptericola jiangsuensis]|uniref:hypothetical protein n=1 Tax=Isoptericola jiangsuensis TaxID=548579 RepID=UPI003AAFDAE6